MKCFLISICLNVKRIVQPIFFIFEAFNMENGFHFHKVLKSYQASLTVQKGTIDKLLFLLKTIGIYQWPVSMIL